MKIGIEAKWYFEGPPSGRRVIKSLVNHLLQIDNHNEYYIILNKKHRNEKFEYANKKNVKLIYVWAGNNLLSNLFIVPFAIRNKGIDVVIYQNFISLFGKSKKIAYVHDVLFLSNPEYYTIWERIYFSPLKFLTQKANSVITVSNEEKKRLVKYQFHRNESRIFVIHHGVDESFNSKEYFNAQMKQMIQKKYNLPDNFLLFVGRLNIRKNLDNLIRAIPYLEDTSIQLVVVGQEDWKKSNHFHTISSLKIQERILFTGEINENLNIVYSLAKVFCFPSLAESFGLPALEAMASGIPVVVSNTTSLPEICGEAGTYVNPNNPNDIAEKINFLLRDPTIYDEKVKNSKSISKKFTWENSASKIIECCLNTLKYD